MIPERARALFEAEDQRNAARTDRMFASLLVVEWVAAVAFAALVSPYTWQGTTASVHVHVWLALGGGAAICSLPLLLAWTAPGRPATRHVMACAQMTWSAVLIHLSGGRIETHFHVFGSLAFVSFYRDWTVLVPATLVVVVDHLFRGLWWPESVYGVANPEWWRFLEHAGWVVFEDAFLLRNCVNARAEMVELSLQRARAEQAASELGDANERLRAEAAERSAVLVELEVARDAAVAASRAKGTFLANMSHELRTPLNAILGYAELVAEDPTVRANDEVSGDLDRIRSAGSHLLNLVSGVLDLAKIEAGRLEVAPSAVDVPRLVEEVAATVAPLAAQNGNTLEILCPASVGVVTADRGMVAQILVNLLGNACKFTSGGRVVLRVLPGGADEDRRVEFVVEDTGRGIPADRIAHVFDEFVQVDPTSAPRQGGTGLGLAISRRLAELMGGRLTATSVLGAGSTFTFTLPVARVAST